MKTPMKKQKGKLNNHFNIPMNFKMYLSECQIGIGVGVISEMHQGQVVQGNTVVLQANYI